MRTCDIIVAIHQTVKRGDKSKRGPESFDEYGAAGGVEAGPYKIANVNLDGLHSTEYYCRDGMGRTVYCYTREARLMEPDEDRSAAIDRTIKSGVILLVPSADGQRHEVEARVLAVSDYYEGNAPESWGPWQGRSEQC